MQKKRGIEEVDPDNTQRLLLEAIFVVEHTDMDDDLAVVIPWVSLVLHAHPAVALIGALKAARCHSVGEGEEGGAIPARWPQPFDIETMLMVEHALQAFTRDVALATAVDGVTDRHVVSGDGLRD